MTDDAVLLVTFVVAVVVFLKTRPTVGAALHSQFSEAFSSPKELLEKTSVPSLNPMKEATTA